MKSPVFLFSLPRSGSTLLQRVLMSHSQVASVAEPWLMLPFCYANKPKGALTEYSHNVSCDAIEDFIDNLPNKEVDYYEALGDFASMLYRKQCKCNEVYFLDKTPRYYLIISEILKAFPDAKFIFLFRNPVHVMSSMMQTWSNGNFRKMYAYERDLYLGPGALSEGYELLGNRALAVQYEQFVLNPQEHLIKICDYLDIDVEEQMLESFSNQNTNGRMGDPTGVKEYSTISSASLKKWEATFGTSFRRKVAYDYLNSIDEQTLSIQGYEKNELLDEVQNINVKLSMSIKDRVDIFYSKVVRYMKANVIFGRKLGAWARSIYLS